MRFNEEQLEKMAAPINQSEMQQCKNAIVLVREALKCFDYTDDGLELQPYAEESYSYVHYMENRRNNYKITLLVQGSYANKTNIPLESDIDVAVILESVFTARFRNGVTQGSYGFIDSDSNVKNLKDDVFRALNIYFHNQGVERHDKSIRVVGNTCHVDADIVPAYRHRDYSCDYQNNEENYIKGIEIRPDSGGKIINYPEQHIEFGTQKNKETMYNFKKCVRIMKNIKYIMACDGCIIPEQISSFGIESLLWNIPSTAYTEHSDMLMVTFINILASLMEDFENFGSYKEANGIKVLFDDEEKSLAYKKFIIALYRYFKGNR